jgi:hypothetical protein
VYELGFGSGLSPNGPDVPLLGRVCFERRGAHGKLAGLRCRLTGPPGPCAEGEGGAG